MGNVRDVGFTVGYTLPTDVPITVEGGLFNGSGLTNQKEWHKEVNYSAKAQFLFTKGLNLTLSVQSIQPEEVRMQSYDIGAYYETGRFHIEGEYLYKQYSGNAFKDVHAVNTFINYDLPLRKVFNKMSFLLRYDMMTDQSDAKTADEETGRLTVTDYKRQRPDGRHHLQPQQGIPHRPPAELREILLCQKQHSERVGTRQGGIGIDGTLLIFPDFPLLFSFQKGIFLINPISQK